MNKEKLVSKRNGEVAEVVKIENGVYTLLVQGKQIEIKEATIKRWWKKEDIKQEEKKETLAESKKEDKKEMKKEIKKEVKIQKKITKKEVKQENSKIGSSQKKIVRIKTSFPLRSYWNFCSYGRYKDLRNGIAKLNADQKKELFHYFLQNDKDGKHSKWLKKEGLIK